MRILIAALAVSLGLVIAGCSSAPTGNAATAFDYQIEEDLLADKPIKKVILSPQPLGAPTLSHLRRGEQRVKAQVKDYLKSNGFEVLPDYHFKNAWNQAVRTYGRAYDPSTGRVDGETWRRLMVATGQYLRDNTDVDAIIFADVIEHKTQHSASLKHYARWFGVTRKPNLVGTGNAIPADFDWSQNVKVASLKISIFDRELRNIFNSYGGIDVTQGIDMRSSDPTFIRRKKLLGSEGFIEEGIELAFHPIIEMKGYPGKSLEQRRQEMAAEAAAKEAAQ